LFFGLPLTADGMALLTAIRLDAIESSRGRVIMTGMSVVAAHFTEGNFRFGSVISRSGSVMSRHLLIFLIVSLIAHSPILLEPGTQAGEPMDLAQALSMLGWGLLTLALLISLSTLGQAAIVHAAFQDMRRRPVRLAESLNVSLRRFLPIIGFSLLGGLLGLLGLILLIIPGLILYTMWIVGLPACVIERLGPWTSLRRSQELTKGDRWKLFGLTLLLIIPSFGGLGIESGLSAVAGPIVGLIVKYVWTGIWGAFIAVLVAVTYHDLRVIKEGVDIEQIAGVFD
jgi:hypothetical protein